MNEETQKISFEFKRGELPTEEQIQAEVANNDNVRPEERERVVAAIMKTLGRIQFTRDVVTELKRGDATLRLRTIPRGEAKNHPDLKPLLVWTERRELIMGYTDGAIWDSEMVMYDACMVVRYSASHFGVLGLCTQGPDDECRVTPSSKRLHVTKVEWAADVEPEAIANWERRPWLR